MTVAFLDTETNGLNRARCQAWEVGLILPGGDEHRWFLPIAVADSDPISLDIGGYHRRHPDGNVYEPGVWVSLEGQSTDHGLVETADFADLFVDLTHGLTLAGAVVDFDAGLLYRLCQQAGCMPSWHYHLIDVETRAAGFVVGREVEYEPVGGARIWKPGHHIKMIELATPPYDSEALSEAVGVDPSRYERHTALGDCRWARAVYEATS